VVLVGHAHLAEERALWSGEGNHGGEM
jgi:hypothetical protein